MAKSIRSKIKRKHRAEFRRTIGTVWISILANCIVVDSILIFFDAHTRLLLRPQDAHDKAMEKVQSKLQEVVKKGSMKSFDRLADMLDTDGEPMAEDATPPTPVVATGENRAPAKGGFKKTVKRKHKMRNNGTKDLPPSTKKERPKPKYFCEF